MVILEKESFEKFGYYARDLTPKSHKRIIVACDMCGKIRENDKSAYRAICQSCARRSENLSEKTKQMRRESLIGENNYSWKLRIKTVCEICGNEFMVKAYIIKKGEGRYCSRKCKNIAQFKNFAGKNSPNWKGGISFEPYCEKFDEKFREYIRNKFDRKCFLCGKTEEENSKKLNRTSCVI